jgi:hypothetical protein
MKMAAPNLPSSAMPPSINYKPHAPCRALQQQQSNRGKK